ncbi:MAG TPA: type II toxin-antitoxin system RelE/ParE family toxin [Caulobacteraceae bacterium]
MQTVIETPAYLADAAVAGMTPAERIAAVNTLARTPEAGDIIVGAGGCRKVRLAGRGKGKSGGYRLITFFAHGGAPVFLLTVFSKGERADLTARERAALAAVAKPLVASLGPRAVTKEV